MANMVNDTQKLLRPALSNNAGGVVVDDRGRNVWRWKDGSENDSTSIVRKRLEADLELEPTRTAKKLGPIPERRPAAAARAPEKGVAPRAAGKARADAKPRAVAKPLAVVDGGGGHVKGGGFDPYNSG